MNRDLFLRFGRLLFVSSFPVTNVLNKVPFQPGQNVNTENFSYLESEILGKKGDGRKKIKEKKNDKKETMNLDLQQETQASKLRRKY